MAVGSRQLVVGGCKNSQPGDFCAVYQMSSTAYKIAEKTRC